MSCKFDPELLAESLPRPLAAYVQLALLARAKGQALPCHKFLILTAIWARESGFSPAAEASRQYVVVANPRHLLAKWNSFAIAFETPEFQAYRQQLIRFCTPERAEHLTVLQGLTVEGHTGTTLQNWLAELA